MIPFGRFIALVALTNKFQRVKRAMFSTGEDRQENDAEHSWQVLFVAYALIVSYELPYRLELVMRYAAVHDLPEVHAEDVDIYDDEARKLKHEREVASLARMRAELPEFELIFRDIDAYEARADPESIFVSSLDKLLPTTNIFLDGGRSWKAKDDITLEKMLSKKQGITDPFVKALFLELVEKIRAEGPEIFERDPSVKIPNCS